MWGRTLLSAAFDLDLRYPSKKFESLEDELQSRSPSEDQHQKRRTGVSAAHRIKSSASFEGVLLFQFGQGGAHVGLKFFRLRHQGRVGRGPLAFESQQLLAP